MMLINKMHTHWTSSPRSVSRNHKEQLCRVHPIRKARMVKVRDATTSNGSQLPAVQDIRTRAKLKVLELLAQGCNNYNPGPELGLAVDQLIQTNPTHEPGLDTFTLGQGKWQVFYAPHIANMSSAMGARFDPIWYILQGDAIISNVKYTAPLIGSGWLSAAGKLVAKDSGTLEVSFSRFWVDLGEDNLRGDLDEDASMLSSTDQMIMASGKAMFFPQFSLFPVLYLDNDLAVFKFPPLDSKIAIQRIS